ncbi:hypothetical protein [aff. Roholtiella sp. LEGE 12411]|uniref:hypothetical protein n=1 Tax=aff. Roholtiella sp. LEGE 12411 TaxID=1828822 RepID=UPI0018809500|nr:hypothetical protein [aff. Roholtiella sp. LEGE 12411]MBE9039071.1 hypothetical protein [aff. Roholtiella sp. LEGE 12411]
MLLAIAIANLFSGRHPQDTLELMQAIALKILHSQRHLIDLTGKFHTLPGFYSKIPSLEPSHQGARESVSLIEFSHIKLGEYLCGEALTAELKFLTQR